MGQQGASGKLRPVLGTTAHSTTGAQLPSSLGFPSQSWGVLPQDWLSWGPLKASCVTAGLSQHCHLQGDSPLVSWEVEEDDGFQFPGILGPNPGIVSKGTRIGSSKPKTGFLPQLFVSSGFLRTWTDEGAGPEEGVDRNGRGDPQTTGSLYWGTPGGNSYTGRPMSVTRGLRVSSGLRP